MPARRYIIICLAILGVALGVTPLARAVNYTFATIDFPGSSSTDIFGVNDDGKIVGSYEDDDGKAHGFVLEGNYFTTVDFPDASGTWAFGINDINQIVGPYTDIAGMYHGFLFDNGTFTTIDYPGTVRTEAKGINNTGKVVGYYVDASRVSHGFLFYGGNYSTIDFPAASWTRAFGINDKGKIVGEYGNTAGKYGFVLDGENFSTIGFPGASETRAIGINDFDNITGRYKDVNGWHGFLFADGNLSTIDYPDASWTRATGINNDGNIVGRYWDTSGGRHGFLATPDYCTYTSYLKRSYIRFNHKEESRDKALFWICIPQTFCDAIKANPDEIIFELTGYGPLAIPGSMLKPNWNKTMFIASSATYTLKIDCNKGWLLFHLKNVALKGLILNPVKTCVYIKDSQCICAEEEFTEKQDKQGKIVKLLSTATTTTCLP